MIIYALYVIYRYMFLANHVSKSITFMY